MRNIELASKHITDLSYSSLYPVDYPSNVDMTAQKDYFFASDDDRMIKSEVYEIRTYSIPDGITDQEFINEYFKVSYLYRMDIPSEYMDKMNIDQIIALSGYSEESLIGISKILKTKNFRSSFRKSLRDQLENWIKGESTFKLPLSPKQVSCISQPKWYR